MAHSSLPLRLVLLVGLVLCLSSTCHAQCRTLAAGMSEEGQVTPNQPSQCFTIAKPPFTKELLMVDTATYDIREGYYICTSVSGGAIGQGCSSDLREADESICLSGIDGLSTIDIEVSCNGRDSLGCQTLFSGRYRLNARWVFTTDECKKIMPLPSSSDRLVASSSLLFVLFFLSLLLLS